MEDISVKLKKAYDGSVIARVVSAIIFHKPMKNKLVVVKLGDKNNGMYPNKEEIQSTSEAFGSIVKENPEHYSNTEFLITGPNITFKAYDTQQMKNKMTVFMLGNENHPLDDEDFEFIKKQIYDKMTALKIGEDKFIITRHPIKVIRQKKVETDGK